MNYRSGRIPLLLKEGWPCHQEKGPVPKWHGRVVAHKLSSGMRFETWCVSDHPVTPPRGFAHKVAGVADSPPHEEGNVPLLRLYVQKPLLAKEGNTRREFIRRKTGGHRPPLQ